MVGFSSHNPSFLNKFNESELVALSSKQVSPSEAGFSIGRVTCNGQNNVTCYFRIESNLSRDTWFDFRGATLYDSSGKVTGASRRSCGEQSQYLTVPPNVSIKCTVQFRGVSGSLVLFTAKFRSVPKGSSRATNFEIRRRFN